MESFNEEVALLVGQNGPLDGKRWPLRNTLLVGRDPACDIMIPDRQVSRHHARFISVTDGTLIEDLGSKNGTHWNGMPVDDPVQLQDGDVIQIALAQQFVYLSSDATVPLDVSEISSLSMPSQISSQVGYGDGGGSTRKLILDSRTREVWLRTLDPQGAESTSEPVTPKKKLVPPLSAFQFRLLHCMFENQGQVIARKDLITAVWGKEQAIEVSEQALDALIRRLRDRLAELDPTHEYILTIRGHGLRLDNPPFP